MSRIHSPGAAPATHRSTPQGEAAGLAAEEGRIVKVVEIFWRGGG
ncbi:hypothetical protein [Streptosporangium sp. 'caverna']|nr:hypothetical protein [Streptosporangium sp. 'caverna']